MTPKEAMKEKNELKARQNITNQATRARKYPDRSVGDKVKIYRKRKPGEKERVGVWGKESHEIEKKRRRRTKVIFM